MCFVYVYVYVYVHVYVYVYSEGTCASHMTDASKPTKKRWESKLTDSWFAL